MWGAPGWRQTVWIRLQRVLCGRLIGLQLFVLEPDVERGRVRRGMVLAAALLSAVAVGPAFAADPPSPGAERVTVQIPRPEAFTDFKATCIGLDERTRGLLNDLTHFIRVTGARYVSDGGTFEITLTDIDMAGEFETWRGPQACSVRVMLDIYAPRIRLEFRLTDRDGKVVSSGPRDLRDPLYLTRAAAGMVPAGIRGPDRRRVRLCWSHEMTEMRVVDLCTCRQTSKPMVLLEDVGRSRWRSFYLPMNEANRLARVLGKTCCAGVPIFNLIGEIAEAGGLEVVRAEIDGDHRGVNASLVVRRAGRDLAMVCHPADALALALRAPVPILASDAALAHACPADHELRAHAVRRWLDRLRPADFGDGSGIGE